MPRLLVCASLLALLTLVICPSPLLSGTPATSSAIAPRLDTYQLADGRDGAVLHGDGVALGKAVTDTIFLYGGPGSLAGKFETELLAPDRQGWVGADLTEVLPKWHLSSFNAANLGSAPAYWSGPYAVPATNHAMWDGVPADTPGYNSAPGYGNGWHDVLERRFTVANLLAPTTLEWDFQFNFDIEPGYDYFYAQWDSAGTFVDLATFTGDNRDSTGAFAGPTSFHANLDVHPGQYAGPNYNQVHLRVRFDSDGAWSDEDGLWNTDGAVQLDNIQVNGNNGVELSQATHEDDADGGWVAVPSEFAGDFSKVIALLGCEYDPCRDDNTPQMTFIDDGTPPNNDPLGRSTGGTTSSTFDICDGWVVNYHGGLTLGVLPLSNEVWSPSIAWDLLGPEDDAVEGGAFLRFTTYDYLPLTNGIFRTWSVRSSPDPTTGGWSAWRDRGFVYHSESALYHLLQLDVRDLLVPDPTQVQVALGMRDMAALFAFPGYDATVAPTFDNIAFAKYATIGPRITTRTVDIFQDGFAESGASGCTAPPADYAIRVDMARDIRPLGTPSAVAGDSLIVDVTPTKPGALIDTTAIFMEFVVQTQLPDHFATARSLALAGLSAAQIAPDRWRGSVAGLRSRTAAGAVVSNRWFFDLPDGATTAAAYQSPECPVFFPGDQLRYFVRASTLNPAEMALLPPDTAGFAEGGGYDRVFTINGLPTLAFSGPTTCSQPLVLVWNELEHRGGEEELLLAFQQNGLHERDSFDVYTPKGPTSAVSNGLGGLHGATAPQMAGYDILFYESGDLTYSLISDGSGAGNNDKGNDVAVLTAWFSQPANRYAAYWGDNIASGLRGGALTYLSNVMKVAFVANDARSSIGNQTAPGVGPTAAGSVRGFLTRFIAYGGCLGINQFDYINPGTGAVKAHEFRNPAGVGGVYVPSASVYYAKQDTLAAQAYDRVNVTFPYGLCYVQDVQGGGGSGGNRSARANLVRELLGGFGYPFEISDPTGVDAPGARRLVVAQVHPNPFNPSTEIAFTAPARGRLTVRIYNLRGERVTTLLDGDVDAGEQRLQWRGVDARGRAVASGVYLLEVSGFGQRELRKLALVR